MNKVYTIEYACATTMGNVRKNNEDNFYCNGEFRRDPNSKDEVLLSGKVTSKENHLFAVYDGMGGESCGEVASYIAAQNSFEFCKNKNKYNDYLYELAYDLNEKVKEETKKRALVLMGTTATMIQFNKKEIYILNLGDSRIYKLTNGSMTQLSHDHTVEGYNGKSPLTNFLGVPRPDHPYSPYIARGSYKANDIFILCTDGITDMITDNALQNMITNMQNAGLSLSQIASNVITTAKNNGGWDNATLILCKICV